METGRLILFDFSGTLSMDAAAFGRPDRLVAAFGRTGLRDLGIDAVDLFWNAFVNPTWAEGSTTDAGYGAVLTRRIQAWRRENGLPAVPDERVGEAAGRFVAAYLDASRIDGRWRPVLHRVLSAPDALPIVVTDHYAEATRAIAGHLGALGIRAAGARDAFDRLQPRTVIIANSADLGFPKDSIRFWSLLKEGLSLSRVRRILLFDDFGSHEQAGDRYGAGERVARRRKETIALIAGVFGVEVTAPPFTAGAGEERTGRDASYGERIREAGDIVDAFLGSGCRSGGKRAAPERRDGP